ncbi:MAG TPA: MASE1 domain-containing protein [Gemmatimonadaceae bacterium]|nr:MASE1 domain-containing protein [Gemmatimonadaceae bacterium]
MRDYLQLKVAGKIAVIAVLYVMSGRAGLNIETISGFATLVWPPTGIALAALLLGGYTLWPGVFIGAVVANVLTGAPLLVAVGFGVGNTLEALIGAYALIRLVNFRPAIDRVQDALGLIVLAAGLSTLVSATIGVASLVLGGITPRSQVLDTWRAWWLGDAIGALVVAPPILVLTAKPEFPRKWRLLEATVLTIAVITISIRVFTRPPATLGGPLSRAYELFPFLIWAAIRFRQHGAVSMSLIVSVIAVWGTVMGHGPFVQPTLHSSLLALQVFLGVMGATFLILGASAAERERAAHDLKVAHRIAAAANEAKAEFLAVMSHELRTPLNAIAGYAELLSLGVAGSLTAKQADAVGRIQRNEQHLLGLIDDVLNFARAEAGSTKLEPRALSIKHEFDALEPIVQPNLDRKRLQLVREQFDSHLSVTADPLKLRQILLNIIGNAIKFTPAGGSITLAATPVNNQVALTVTDTGIGVPSDKVVQIFEPFFQVDSGTTREYSGVGLGLAIARDLARAMGGDVYFDSTVGRGSVVSILLPRNDSE